MELFGIKLETKEFDFLMCEQSKGKQLKVIDGKVVAVERIESEEDKKVKRIRELKYFLEQSDFKLFKFMEGIISAEEYEPTKLQRQAWRAEINLLQGN